MILSKQSNWPMISHELERANFPLSHTFPRRSFRRRHCRGRIPHVCDCCRRRGQVLGLQLGRPAGNREQRESVPTSGRDRCRGWNARASEFATRKEETHQNRPVNVIGDQLSNIHQCVFLERLSWYELFLSFGPVQLLTCAQN